MVAWAVGRVVASTNLMGTGRGDVRNGCSTSRLFHENILCWPRGPLAYAAWSSSVLAMV